MQTTVPKASSLRRGEIGWKEEEEDSVLGVLSDGRMHIEEFKGEEEEEIGVLATMQQSGAEAATRKKTVVGVGARVLFYPTLLYNVLRNKIQSEFHWWDEVDEVIPLKFYLLFFSLASSNFRFPSPFVILRILLPGILNSIFHEGSYAL